MSRIGKMPVQIPDNVKIELRDSTIEFQGPKGKLSMQRVAGIEAEIEGGQLKFTRPNDLKQTRAAHGLARSLAHNMVHGVSHGFTRTLEVQGVGYRVEVRGQKLVLNLGYSHPIEVDIPADMKIEANNNKIIVSGTDKGRVGQLAADIRAFRPPDRYKGKGVRYEGEYVLLKAGKSA